MTSVAATKRGYPGMQHVTMGVGVVSGGYTAVVGLHQAVYLQVLPYAFGTGCAGPVDNGAL